MVKEQSLSVLIKQADEVFSEFIRLRDAASFCGHVKCFICSTEKHWRQMQCMHFITRDAMATRFDEDNCHTGCESCNCYDGEHCDKYRVEMEKVYGPNIVYDLLSRSRSLAKFTRSDVSEMIGKYKEKIKELRKQKHL